MQPMQPHQYNYYSHGQHPPPPPPPPPPPSTSYQPYPPPTYYSQSQPYAYPPPQYYSYSPSPPVQYHQQYHVPPQPPQPHYAQYYAPPRPPPPPSAVTHLPAARPAQYTHRTTNPIPNTKHFCEPCDKEFTSYGAYTTHLKTHEKCPDPNCSFTASKRVVSTHYDLTHGIYGGHGYKVIDVEGQKFKVLMGTDPSEVEQWRSERRKRFPTAAAVAQREQSHQKYLEQGGIDKRSKKRKVDKISPSESASVEPSNPLSQLAQYGSDEEQPATIDLTENVDVSSKKKKKKVCSYFIKGKCRHGDRCRFLHERASDSEPTDNTTVTKKEKGEKVEKKGGLHLPKPLVGGKDGSLYRKLIEELVHDDESLILQCFRYFVQENFFQPADTSS